MKLANVIVPSAEPSGPVDITVTNGRVESIQPAAHSAATPPPSLLLPSLCHPHIHLDKPYILTCNNASHGPKHPDYSDLNPETGEFQEALQNTSLAKTRYTPEDLYLRGAQLLATSYQQGVTHVRAFVEVDHAVEFKTLEAGIRLKQAFAPFVTVQLCVFAQDPIMSGSHGAENLGLVQEALSRYSDHVDVLGTTPYVEANRAAAQANVEWAIETALARGLDLDFHIDYDLDTAQAPLTQTVVDELIRQGWQSKASAGKTVLLGHATRLAEMGFPWLRSLSDTIKREKLPVHFVGLPTSDVFMMGRAPTAAGEQGSERAATSESRPRGTLPVPLLIQQLGLDACLAVNNVGNAFTPYGTGDPLSLASWGVGLYHAGTVRDAELLYACVSWRARRAIGLEQGDESAKIEAGSLWRPMLLVQNPESIEIPGGGGAHDTSRDVVADAGEGLTAAIKIPARQRLSIKDVVWDPPETRWRRVVR